jgi:hypothetical protein
LSIAIAGGTGPSSAVAADKDPTTLVAEFDGESLPEPGDVGGSGTLALALGPQEICYRIELSLSDLEGDPPTSIDLHDATTGDPGDVAFHLADSVDASGVAEDCFAGSNTTIQDIVANPENYVAVVYTAGYPDGAVSGRVHDDWPFFHLGVVTRVCPPDVQSPNQLADEEIAATCESVVLPKDALTDFPPGYTIIGYGGTRTFDYHVVDDAGFDATIADAERGGGGTCSSETMTCWFDSLPYEWYDLDGETVAIDPVVIPAGLRFGAAASSLPLDVDPDGVMLLDAVDISAGEMYGVAVYLFQQPDAAAPVVSTPVVRFRSGTYEGFGPVNLTWTGSDTGSGIDHYTVQRSRDGGAWATIGSDLQATWLATALAKGHTYRFRVRAVDEAGNVGAWKTSPVERFRGIQDGSRAIDYVGTWRTATTSTASGGTLHSSTASGSMARFTFTGRAVAWVAPIGSSRGQARIYLDGTWVKTVDLHGPASPRRIVYTRTFGSVGTHRLTVRVVGTSGHPRVDVDAFLVVY